MSDHRIEDLVEESVRLVLQGPMPDGDKRALIADLFAFQAMFDTSDTLGRVEAELATIDYRGEGNETGRPLLVIVAAIMGLADAAGNRQMVHHWLAVLVRTLRELELDEGMVPRSFIAFRQTPEAIAIREAAIRQRASGFWDGYIELPRWSEMNRSYNKVDPKVGDRRSILRFLLDHKASVEAIVTGFEKEHEKAKKRAAVLAQIPEMVSARGDFRYLGQQSHWGDEIFIFEIGDPPADPDGLRFYLLMEHHEVARILYPRIGVRSGMIQRWQGRSFAADDRTMHFRESLGTFIPPAKLKADDGFTGLGWNWGLGQPAKLLAERLDTIMGHWASTRKFVDFYSKPSLAARLDEEGFAVMAKKRKQRRNALGYFANEVDMLFALACRRWDRGERPEEEIAAIHDWLLHIYPDVRADRVACLEKLKDGPAFPVEIEKLPFKRFNEPFEPLQRPTGFCSPHTLTNH
ncbi:hypothetical protein ACRQ1B_24880 [Rhizobium panacihumi]|uniref:hypothetical protein n=1 Tax=Rhizobium panacihumi TaxID=2008450 RepID=UPI003D799F38